MLAPFVLLVASLQDPSPAPPTAPTAVSSTAADSWFTPAQAAACSAAADRGLAWLAAQQLEAGCWTGYVGHKMNDGYVELENGLKAILIHDSEADKASAALDVAVGTLFVLRV